MYTLISQGTFSPVWLQKCVQVFSCSSPGPELDSCLWSLTEVLKRLLKGPHQGKTLCHPTQGPETLCSFRDSQPKTAELVVDEPAEPRVSST